MGVTGAAQLAVANAERQKVKRMTLNGSASGTSSAGSRIASGRESGGRIDVEREQDGKHFNAEYSPGKRGYIDKPTVIVGEGPKGRSKEWVASNAALENPTIAPLIHLMDAAQRAGQIRTFDMGKYLMAMQGRALGGSIEPAPYPLRTRSVPSLSGADSYVATQEFHIATRELLRPDAVMTSSWHCSGSFATTESTPISRSRSLMPSRN